MSHIGHTKAMNDIARSVDRGQVTVTLHVPGADSFNALSDVLTDLAHWAEARGVSFERAVAEAQFATGVERRKEQRREGDTPRLK